MTENKRFEICGEGSTNLDVTTYIVEYGDGDDDCFELYESKEDSQKVCDKINNILDENEKLKENCKNYNWYKHYKTLLNENEQLKKENLDLEELDYYKTKCASLETGLFQADKENGQLKASLYAEKTNTAEVVNDYSKQFKRHSAQFSFMMDLADDLGVDVTTLEALDD